SKSNEKSKSLCSGGQPSPASFRPFAARRRSECAQDARPALRGPCAAVRWGRQARRGIGRTPIPFRQYTDVLSKSPAPPHGLSAQGRAESAKRGGLLFWLLFSWPRKRKVTRPPSGGRNAFAIRATQPSPAQEHPRDETRRHHRHGRHHAAGPRLAHDFRAPAPTPQRRAPHARMGLLRRAERPPRLPGGRLRAAAVATPENPLDGPRLAT